MSSLYLLLFDHYEVTMTKESMVRLTTLFLAHCHCAGARQPDLNDAYLDSHMDGCGYVKRAEALLKTEAEPITMRAAEG
jgi:hypothetical protein